MTVRPAYGSVGFSCFRSGTGTAPVARRATRDCAPEKK
jgi:hypothetical protein